MKIQLTESQLKQMINEAIKTELNEGYIEGPGYRSALHYLDMAIYDFDMAIQCEKVQIEPRIKLCFNAIKKFINSENIRFRDEERANMPVDNDDYSPWRPGDDTISYRA